MTNITKTYGEYYNFSVPEYATKDIVYDTLDNEVSPDAGKLQVEYKFVYNYYNAQYQQKYVNNIDETKFANFYKLIDQYYFANNSTIVDRNKKTIADILIGDSDNLTDENLNYSHKNLDKYLNSRNAYANLFPMYTEINFANEYRRDNYFTDFFNDQEIYSKFLDECENLKNNNQPYNLQTFFSNNVNKNNKNLYINSLNHIVNKLNLADNKGNSYYEIVGYKISKFVDNIKNSIQDFYIANTKQENIKFIDSQVKYARKYRYQLSMYVLFLSRQVDGSCKIYLQNMPCGSIYEGTIYSTPPLSPEIDFIPYIDVKNKFKIALSTKFGKEIKDYVSINTSDNELINLVKESQKHLNSINQYLFKTDDINAQYEIFRLEYVPTSINDFRSSLYTTVNSRGAISAFYEDTIIPNKKYYYIFRAIDVNGLISNPSEIYTYEIKVENDSVQPIYGLYNIETMKHTVVDADRKFNKHIRLVPASGHISPKSEVQSSTQINNIKNTQIGYLNPSLWDKRFKIRITSLNSGKKMEVIIPYEVKRT